MVRYYNQRVRVRCYKIDDLVLRLVLPGARKSYEGTLGTSWEGPYIVKENLGNGAYHLANMDETTPPTSLERRASETLFSISKHSSLIIFFDILPSLILF